MFIFQIYKIHIQILLSASKLHISKNRFRMLEQLTIRKTLEEPFFKDCRVITGLTTKHTHTDCLDKEIITL